MQSIAEPLQVVELLREPAQVAGAVVVAVEEAADVDLVEDRALEPQRVGLEPLPAALRTTGARAAASRSTGRRRRRRDQARAVGVARSGSRTSSLTTCRTWRWPGAEADVVAGRCARRSVSSVSSPARANDGRQAERGGHDRAAPRASANGSRLTHDDDRVRRRRASRTRSGARSRSRGTSTFVERWSAGFARRISFRRRDERQQRPVERPLLHLVLLRVEVLLAALRAPARSRSCSKPE